MADVSSRDAVFALAADIERDHGPVDVLVCNAAYMTMARFLDHDDDDWWKVVDTNLAGTFHLIQAVLPGMRRRGGGNIVVIASEWGVIGWPEASAYSASKAGSDRVGQDAGPRTGAREHQRQRGGARRRPTRPNSRWMPAPRASPSIRCTGATAKPSRSGRIGRPEEIAAAVALLARPDLAAMVGQTLQINGGSTRCRV